jgi:hypothetical protein
VSDKTKQVRRKYSERGTRRTYKQISLDVDAHRDLQELSKKLQLPLVEVLRLAIEKLKNEEKTDFQT